MAVRRDRERGDEGCKVTIKRDAVVEYLAGLLEDIQASLFAQAKAQLERGIVTTDDHDTFLSMCRERAGLVDIAWCNRAECEASVKSETSATTRNLRPLASGQTGMLCVACGEPAAVRAYFAQSY